MPVNKNSIIISLLVLGVVLGVVSVIKLQKPKQKNMAMLGTYICYEITETESKKVLPLQNLHFEIDSDLAKLYNFDTKIELFSGSYDVKKPSRKSMFVGAKHININVENNIFKPSVYYHKDKIYYLDTRIKDNIKLYIFKRENS